MIVVEYFEKLADAERFAHDPVRDTKVIGIYGTQKHGTKKRFQSWLDDAIATERFSEETAAKYTACVVWNR